MIVHLIDGTYELFRIFYGLRRGNSKNPLGAVLGVTRAVVDMLDDGATHIAVATDHVIESFRNDLWPDYKSGAGIDRELWAQFHPLELTLQSLGVVTWPMVELEADDALASAARLAAADSRVEKVCIWTPDKDLGQSVVGERVVQVVRRTGEIRGEKGVIEKFGVLPKFIPDYLALVGDSADGYPGVPGIGAKTAARLIEKHGAIDDFPDETLGGERDHALLFKDLATLRADARLFEDVDDLSWHGPTDAFELAAEKIGDPHLDERVRKLAERLERDGRS